MWEALLEKIRRGDKGALSRAISLVENQSPGSQALLRQLPYQGEVAVTGITGPPGAGKSTISDLIIGEYIKAGQRVCVLCIDPSSSITGGALLGDRIRMGHWHDHPDVFIRSFSTRGILGGLHPLIIEITDLVKGAGFNQILIETAGVGQNEIGISKLADLTIVVLVPEAGDDIQAMKAGLMEIADIFVVNKCDRPDASVFINHLRAACRQMGRERPLVPMTASRGEGIAPLMDAIRKQLSESGRNEEKRIALLTERLWQLVLKNILNGVNRKEMEELVRQQYQAADFNLYKLADRFI